MKFKKIKGYGLGMDCDSNSTKQQVIENKVLIIKIVEEYGTKFSCE